MEEKKKFWKGALCGALVMLLAAGAVFTCLKVKNRTGEKTVEKSVVSSDTEKKLEEIQELIDEQYLHKSSKKDLEDGIYNGYVAALDDPYSVYYNKKETDELMETTSGEYSGIGAVLSQNMDSGIIVINNVYKDCPADEAGMKNDDILYKVEGKEVTGEDLSEVVSRIKGEKGTDVKLTVLRGEEKKEIDLTVTRDTVEARTVESEMLGGKVGYIRITEFDTITYEQYKEALKKLTDQGMKGLVVDLRSNPGGNLSTVCKILELMLPEGKIVYTQDKNGEKKTISSDGENEFKKPLAVLVNGYSASASEIFAGAVQDYGTGEIVGTQTYGKGVVQQLFDLEDGTCVKLTIAEYFTPKGRNIDGKGITPDTVIEYKADKKNPEADNQKDKAVEIVKKGMH